jgi:hypothetical protein
MKKSNRRLTLARETVLFLDPANLPRAAGGSIGPESYVYSNCPTCDSALTNCAAMTHCKSYCPNVC